MAVYKILEEIMSERDLSVADIARMCNLPDSTVRGIVRRKQDSIALEVAFKLSDGLCISLEKLNGMPEKESPSTDESAPGDGTISLEESNRLLSALGLSDEVQQLSGDDFAFLSHIMGLVEAWFRKGH